MVMQAKTGFTGLRTNVAESQMGPGDLLGAENVVIRRPGAIEPRDGLQKAGTVISGTGYAAWGFSWRSKDFYLRNNGSNVFNWRDTGGTAYQYTDLSLGALDPQPFRRDMFSRAEARGSLYVPYDSGVLKMETDSGPWLFAGLPLFVNISSAGANTSGVTWLPNTERVAYRVLVTRTDANGMVLRSAPSGAVVVTNNSGSTAAVDVVFSAVFTSLWDYIELYRTRNFPSGVTPDEEYQLVATIAVAAAGSTHTDRVAVASRGATLYTSPSRGGVAERNEPPPAAAACALFRNSLFFANTRGPRRIKISRPSVLGSATGSATGIGFRNYTATTTNGNPDLTLLSSTVGLEKGMVVQGTGIPVGSYITNISGTTVTISANATASGAGVSLFFWDAISLLGVWTRVDTIDGTTTFANVYSLYKITPPESGSAATLVFETYSRAATARTIQATHGSEYTPPLPNYDGTPLALEQDVWPGGLMWSKPDEPEHVAPGSYVFIGDVNKAILGLVPTRDALFVLKEDGIFRLTGVAGEWRVDPVDPTTYCVLPSSVRAMHGKGYFLSQKGVLTISDSGLETISAAVDDVWKPTVDGIISRWTSSGLYELLNVSGASTACVFERENEYTLMTSDTGPHYVFNGNTGAWTTWSYAKHGAETLPNRSLFNFERTGKAVYGLGTDYYTTLLTTSTFIAIALAQPRFDRETSITVNTFTSASSTITCSSTQNAMLDDLIQDAAGRLWRVTATVTANATLPVSLMGDTAGTAFTTGSCVLYRSMRCSATVGFMEPGALRKRWKRIVTAWSQLVGATVLRHAFQSSESTSSVEEDTDLKKRVSGYTSHTYGYAHSWLVPAAHMRAWALRATTKVIMAFGSFRLEGISIGADAIDEPGTPEVGA